MRGEIQRSQAEIQAQRDSLRGLEQNQGALESTLALVANSVQQMLGGQEARPRNKDPDMLYIFHVIQYV